MALFLVTAGRMISRHQSASVEIEADSEDDALDRAIEMGRAGSLPWEDDDPQGEPELPTFDIEPIDAERRA